MLTIGTGKVELGGEPSDRDIPSLQLPESQHLPPPFVDDLNPVIQNLRTREALPGEQRCRDEVGIVKVLSRIVSGSASG